MVPAPFKVVLDANVLYPFTLRDTLLRAASRGLFQAYWSEQILEEARRNLVSTATITSEQAERLLATMRRAFPESTVRGHETLIAAMQNEEKDRHVAAAAVKVGAQVIVTLNQAPDLVSQRHARVSVPGFADASGPGGRRRSGGGSPLSPHTRRLASRRSSHASSIASARDTAAVMRSTLSGP